MAREVTEEELDDIRRRAKEAGPDIIKKMEAYFESRVANPDGSCKAEGCDGLVIAKIASFSRHGVQRDRRCNKCNRGYDSGGSIDRTSDQKLIDRLNEPYNI